MRASVKNTIIVIILVATFGSGFSVAQTTKFLSLNEAIELCLKNNKQLKLDQVKVEAALASTTEAKNNKLPDVAATASYLRVAKPTISGPLDKGLSTPNINQLTFAMVTASLPVFGGFKIKNGIESAKYLEEAAKLDAESNKNAVVQNLVAAYANLYKAQAMVSLLKENLKQAGLRTTDFTNLENKGIVARNDLLRTQLQQTNIQISLLEAESNMRIANVNMNLMLGLADDTQLQVDSAAFTEVTDARTYKQFEELAFANRREIEAQQFRQRSAAAGVRYAKGDYFPALKLTGGYFAVNVPGFITITNGWNAGLGVSYNIASLWKTGAKVKSAKMQLAQAQTNIAILNDQIKMEVVNAFEEYNLSRSKILMYDQAVQQAAENNRITKNKYRNSLVTTADLLDADIQQLQAVMNYENSKADAVVAYKKLLQTVGVNDSNSNQ